MKQKTLNFLEEAHEELSAEERTSEDDAERMPESIPADENVPIAQNDIEDFQKFAKREGKRTLDTFRDVLIVNHFDCDGLASGSIVALALKAHGIPFRMLTVKKMTNQVIEAAKNDPSRCLIFVDIGTGFLNQINAIAKSGKSILQIDHHAPEKIENKSDAFSIINCHNFNIDGAFYLCSSSAAYFTFAANSPVEAAKRMAQLGIIGAVGDIQDVKGLKGLNYLLLQDAKKLKVVNAVRDLRMFGRVSRTLVNFLNFSAEPFLPSLTGNPKNSALFLKKNGIPLYAEKDGKRAWLRYYDLNRFDRIRLIGALLNFCYEKKLSEDAIHLMIGEVYLFPHENNQTELYDAYEFSSLLNACGRSGKPEVGIKLCLNEAGAYEEAHALLQQHRMEISKAIYYAKKYTEDLGAFYFLDARNDIPDSIIGSVAGSYFNSGMIAREKPIIAFSIDEAQQLKASSRAWRGLVEKGLNLGEVMSLSAKEAGGFGGGHSVASGASIPNTEEALKKFLLSAKLTIKRQIGI
ncbi:MAG: DHH family phosphoesterase [Candidatus Micrarchaeota archaeon]